MNVRTSTRACRVVMIDLGEYCSECKSMGDGEKGLGSECVETSGLLFKICSICGLVVWLVRFRPRFTCKIHARYPTRNLVPPIILLMVVSEVLVDTVVSGVCARL